MALRGLQNMTLNMETADISKQIPVFLFNVRACALGRYNGISCSHFDCHSSRNHQVSKTLPAASIFEMPHKYLNGMLVLSWI
ncbi:hypothetical protein SAMN05216316_0805 [Nitrosovibrio sp. Nv6]|nr:hypothetical protein SAMN05216316_0805 [Nitrosovibrio sp. Nv6]